MPISRELDRDYAVIDAAIVTAGTVLMHGDNPGEAKAPTGANVVPAGVMTRDQDEINEEAPLRKAGFAECIASAAIARGAYVNIADTDGKVKTVSEGAGTRNILGVAETAAAADEDPITVFINIQQG